MSEIKIESPQKSDDTRGQDAAHTRLEKEADDAATKAQKSEKKYDEDNPIFTK